MTARGSILQSLQDIKNEIKAAYKVKSLWLFGSFARGEEKLTSDVDILVDFEKGADLFNLMALASFLEEQFGRRVDIVSKDALRPELKEIVFKEMLAV